MESKTKKKTAAAKADEDTAKGLSMKDCSAKYQAAKDAGTLGGMKWNDFRKAECGPGTTTEIESKTKKKTAAAKADDDTAKGLSMKECSARYQQAKAEGTLGGLKWNSFRKAKCSADAADDETVPAPDEATYTNEPETPTTRAPRSVKFPRGIATKYSSESAGRARMHTCLDQYYANKENNALGGLKWIQKGGGYYSLCNARLKPGA
ncbi:MAG: antifreeze protein [Parvibaculaceae bacterium]